MDQELVSYLDRRFAENQDATRRLFEAFGAGIRKDLGDKIDTEIRAVRKDLGEEIQATRKDLGEEIQATRRDLGDKIDTEIRAVRKDLGEEIQATRKDLGDKIDTEIRATRKDLGDKIDTEVQALREEIRHGNVMLEDVRSHQETIAEAVVGMSAKIDRYQEQNEKARQEDRAFFTSLFRDTKGRVDAHDTRLDDCEARITRLESART